MKKLGGATRRDLYERYDRPAMRSLPATAYEISEWKQVRVNLDYHVEVDKHWYSAPYVLVREELWACSTETMVQLFHRGHRVAAHARSRVPHKYTTDRAHMPESHRMHSAGVDGVLAWAANFGPFTEAMVRRLIEANPIREQGWRSARGLQRVAEKYGAERTERACARALFLGAHSYKPVANILSLGREQLALPGEEPVEAQAIAHENVRGPDYYQ